MAGWRQALSLASAARESLWMSSRPHRRPSCRGSASMSPCRSLGPPPARQPAVSGGDTTTERYRPHVRGVEVGVGHSIRGGRGALIRAELARTLPCDGHGINMRHIQRTAVLRILTEEVRAVRAIFRSSSKSCSCVSVGCLSGLRQTRISVTPFQNHISIYDIQGRTTISIYQHT